MNFQSLHFLLFLFGLILACGLLWRNFASRKNLLLVASYYFYMSWDWRFGGLLAITTIVHFAVGRKLADEKRQGWRRAWLTLSVLAGLGVLAYFKYANFFIQSAVVLLKAFGIEAQPSTLSIFLPIGISFYTFQALSYVFDIYRRQQEPTRDLRDFALFVGFFPTVLAGPITRASCLLPQLTHQQVVPGDEVETGMWLVAQGFLKKVVFADVLGAQMVDPAFANPEAYSPLFLLTALYAYSFQIYMDVSGYTDIARGAALMCGFRLPPNFDRPYSARTVSNFWQRWHMSMSSFFRDYVFIGLGGSRHGHAYFNLMLTFLAIGLWHGGGWNFLLYGALHGALVCYERFRRSRRVTCGLPAVDERGGWHAVAQIAFVFHFVSFTRLLFRAPDLVSAGQYLSALTDWSRHEFPVSLVGTTALVSAALLHWVYKPNRVDLLHFQRRLPVALTGLLLALAAYVVVVFSSSKAQFVYFMF